MVSFRKWFPALAIVALLLGSAVAASAQTSFTCQTVAGVPPLVRGEGLAELVGDVVLQCTGGTTTLAGAQVPGVNFSVFLNTNITSRVLTNDVTEALLLIDEPLSFNFVTNPVVVTGTGAGPVLNNADPGNGYPIGATVPGGVNYKTGAAPNSFPGKLVQQFAGGTTVLQEYLSWTGIPLDAPGTAGIRTIRITNLRANANRIGVSSTLIPSQIRAFISITSTQSVSIANPEQTVAFVTRGLGDFKVASNSSPYFQCQGFSLSSGVAFVARFVEGYSASFKRRAQGGYTDPVVNASGTGMVTQPQPIPPNTTPWPGSIPGITSQAIPGQNTFTESGFVFGPSAPSPYNLVGVADHGTRLILRFANNPAGVTLYAGTVDTGATGGLVTNARARLISANADGSGGGTFTSSDGTASSSAGWPVAAIPSSGILVYEIVATDPSVVETIDIPIFVSFPVNAGALTPANTLPTVTGALAPLSTVRSEQFGGSGAPIPRFVDTPISGNTFVINPCRTNILFPFVANQDGFDTGIAISNTSKDIYGTTQQSGPCTINYFGNTTGGGAPPNAQTSTSAVEAGGTLRFVVSSGGTNGIVGTPGFLGYIIAQCDFQYGHGFAFITDGPIGAAKVAEGYLGLILDDNISGGRTGYASEALNQ